MSNVTLHDGDWMIRVIVIEKDKDKVHQWVRCRIKDGAIPSKEKIIDYLSKREGYKEGTQYSIHGISAFLEEEADQFPNVME